MKQLIKVSSNKGWATNSSSYSTYYVNVEKNDKVHGWDVLGSNFVSSNYYDYDTANYDMLIPVPMTDKSIYINISHQGDGENWSASAIRLEDIKEDCPFLLEIVTSENPESFSTDTIYVDKCSKSLYIDVCDWTNKWRDDKNAVKLSEELKRLYERCDISCEYLTVIDDILILTDFYPDSEY